MADKKENMRKFACDCDKRDWLLEKSSNITRDLAWALKWMRNSSLTAQEKLEQVENQIASTLYDSTKIMSLACAGNWEPDDRDLVHQNAIAGYKAIRAKYGIDEMTDYSAKLLELKTIEKVEIQQRLDFLAQLNNLLYLPKNESRTPMNELFDKYPFDDNYYGRMNILLNRVNQGELAWSEFCQRITLNIEQWEKHLLPENQAQYIKELYQRIESENAARLKSEYIEQADYENEPGYERAVLNEEYRTMLKEIEKLEKHYDKPSPNL